MEESNNINLQELIKEIPMYKVASSNISALGYNSKRQVLRVMFSNNASYLYFEVEPAMWELLIRSQSKGKFLTEHITRHKEKYKYIKI
ncbi:KTSC domain-containing protein [uncultured Clostridium sp.]|uniref:KTSC domain-containing protein n=1 Tax=uncultured Clostridium sp. TaxID=59620 RepID=UPI0026EC6343|nr:KTSC domain-containing protein [uncultured Clostridium sp.]